MFSAAHYCVAVLTSERTGECVAFCSPANIEVGVERHLSTCPTPNTVALNSQNEEAFTEGRSRSRFIDSLTLTLEENKEYKISAENSAERTCLQQS